MSALPVGAPASRGLLDALRSIGATLNEMLRVRGALFAVELGEELRRRKHMLLLAALGAAFLHMALVLLTLFVAVVFWDTHRVAVIGALALIYLGCGATALMMLRASMASSPRPFDATLGELERDLAELK